MSLTLVAGGSATSTMLMTLIALAVMSSCLKYGEVYFFHVHADVIVIVVITAWNVLQDLL